jgi:hypothetical protein
MTTLTLPTELINDFGVLIKLIKLSLIPYENEKILLLRKLKVISKEIKSRKNAINRLADELASLKEE